MKVLLINDTSKWYHFGCAATSKALIEAIEKIGYIISSLPITETYKIKDAPVTKEGFFDQKQYHNFIKQNPDLIEMIKQHDIVIFNGEGTLHGLNQAPASLLYVAYIAKKEFGKHVEILNHSAYPEHSALLNDTQEAAIYKLVYNIIDFASIREPISFNTMKTLGVHTSESFDCLPLYIRDHYKKTNIKYNDVLLVAGSATWLQLNIPSDLKGNIEDFRQSLSNFNIYLNQMTELGFKIKFLYGAAAYPAKDDREFIEYMNNKLHVNWEVYEATSIMDWLKEIEEATILVSGRFHHTIAAASLGTYFIALNSNTPKIEGLLQILGSDQIIQYDDNKLSERLLTLTYNKLLSSEIGTSFRGNDYMDLLCTKAEKNFDGLKNYKNNKN